MKRPLCLCFDRAFHLCHQTALKCKPPKRRSRRHRPPSPSPASALSRKSVLHNHPSKGRPIPHSVEPAGTARMARFAIAPILALLALFTLSLAPADEVTPSPPTPVPGTAQAPPFFHVPQSRSEESKSHEVANPRLLPPRPPTIQASSAPSTFRTEDNTPLEDAAKTQLRSARPDHPRSGKSRLAPRTPASVFG